MSALILDNQSFWTLGFLLVAGLGITLVVVLHQSQTVLVVTCLHVSDQMRQRLLRT